MAAILVAGCGDGTGPDWRVGEGHIVYSQWRWDDDATPRFTRIYRVRPDGSDRSVLLPGFQDSGLVANELALSPDGGSLAFSARGGVYVARLADESIRVEPGLTSARWDPSGLRRLVAHGSGQIFLVDLDTGTRTPLLDDTWTASFPNWTADGEGILFTGRKDQGLRGLFRLDLATHAITQVYDPGSMPTGSSSLLFWRVSPDGHRVSYSASDPVYPDGSAAPTGAWVLDLRSGAAEWIGGNSVYSCPCPWSPDGGSVVIQEFDSVTSRLVVVDIESREHHLLTDDDDLLEGDPDWRP